MKHLSKTYHFLSMWPLVVALFIIRINLGCASRQQIKPAETAGATADSLQKQVVTQLDGDKMKKTMDYPYLKVRFDQNDTEVEMVLDPESTDLALNLARNVGGDLEIIYGDSTYSDEEKDSRSEDLITGVKNKNGKREDLTDDIIRDIQLAQKFFYEKRYDRALRVLRASLEKKATATAYALGGSIYFVNGEIREAVKAWESALTIDPDLEDVRELVERYKE